MSDKNKKIKIPSLEERKKSHQRALEDLDLKNKLLGSPELFINQEGTDEYLDILSVKIKLNGDRELSLEEYIVDNLVEYRSHFYKDYYYGIAKLCNLDRSVMDEYQKPKFVADFTINFVYARFPKDVVDRLMSKAPWTPIPGIREIKLFQHLSPIATEQLDLYIAQVEEMMRQCDDLTEFKLKYSKKYNLYFQIDMFNDLSSIF